MNRLVVDSSVVVKWFVPEVGSDIADQILELYKSRTLRFLAPDLLFAEVGNIVWKKRRFQDLAVEDGQAIVRAIRWIDFEITPIAELLGEAYELAEVHQRTVYDSLYLALSVREDVPFVTADLKLVHAVERALPNVFDLEDWHRLVGDFESDSDAAS